MVQFDSACSGMMFKGRTVDVITYDDENFEVDFCVRAQGDSMINARIFDGDVLFVKEQDTVDNGEIALVTVGEEATVKRVYFDHESAELLLVPDNPTHKIMRYKGDDLNEVLIIGKIVGGQYRF